MVRGAESGTNRTFCVFCRSDDGYGELRTRRLRRPGNDAITTIVFRSIERCVRPRNDRLGSIAGLDRGDSGGYRNRSPDNGLALLHGTPDPFGENHRVVQSGVRQDQQKLLTTPAAYNIMLPNGLPDRLRRVDKNLVSCRVAEPVVDRLKVIDIGEDD